MAKLLILLLLAQPVQASDPWDWNTLDYTLQGAFIVTLVMDRNQTLRIAADSHEINPLLGSSPSKKTVNIYFLSCAVTHTILMAAIPRPFRNPIQGFSILVEVNQIHTNYVLGYKATF